MELSNKDKQMVWSIVYHLLKPVKPEFRLYSLTITSIQDTDIYEVQITNTSATVIRTYLDKDRMFEKDNSEFLLKNINSLLSSLTCKCGYFSSISFKIKFPEVGSIQVVYKE